MKLKLFLIFIISIIILVAYKKNQEISILKSINSFEACSVAEGSILTESYPSTCITRLGLRFVEPIDSQDLLSDVDYGFEITVPSTLNRTVNIDSINPVVLYCDSPSIIDSNSCTNYGISISIYTEPEFGGACPQYQNLYVGRSLVSYCDDKEAQMLTQIYIDQSKKIQKNSYSILVKYNNTFTVDDAKKILTTLRFTN